MEKCISQVLPLHVWLAVSRQISSGEAKTLTDMDPGIQDPFFFTHFQLLKMYSSALPGKAIMLKKLIFPIASEKAFVQPALQACLNLMFFFFCFVANLSNSCSKLDELWTALTVRIPQETSKVLLRELIIIGANYFKGNIQIGLLSLHIIMSVCVCLSLFAIPRTHAR